MSDIYLKELYDDQAELRLRCGGCQTWRCLALSAQRAAVLERRIARRLERDRREIQAAVWRVELGVEDTDRPKTGRL